MRQRSTANDDIFGDNGLNNRLISADQSQRIAAGPLPPQTKPTHGMTQERATAPAGLKKLPAVRNPGVPLSELERLAKGKRRRKGLPA